MTPYQQHVADWKDCCRCPLWEGRRRVVFARGDVPADVVFVGEAPGLSEDALGQPFVGPAGNLLDRIVNQAAESSRCFVPTAFCNVVGCFPKAAKETDDHSPPRESIEACRPKLDEFLRIARPKLLVLVGAVAQKFAVRPDAVRSFESIIHPAAILRAPIVQRALLIKRAVLTLSAALEELCSGR